VATLLAVADAHRILGDSARATEGYREALLLDADLLAAHIGLALLRMPGDDYRTWMARLQEGMRPETYLEIGVDRGATLSLAQPPTRAIGIDPEPNVAFPFHTETHLFTETSDAFFARQEIVGPRARRPIGLAFVDGLHTFEQSLRDFINLEPLCAPNSAIVFHDTLPLDEITQDRERKTIFWTGDVWKTVLALIAYRPDLVILTIPTPPTGLTLVTGLDPTSSVLADAYDEAVRRFVNLPLPERGEGTDAMFNVVPNDWDVVSARLRDVGIFRADGS
jgi:Methyltransferase domain